MGSQEGGRLSPAPGTTSARKHRPRAAALALSAIVLALAACSSTGSHHPAAAAAPFAVRTRPPASATSVLSGDASAEAAQAARQLFASSPVVVVANSAQPAALARAAAQAGRVHAPLLLTTGPARISAVLGADIRALRPRAILAVGVPASAVSAELGRLPVVTAPALLPRVTAPVPLSKVALLVHHSAGGAPAAAAAAVTAAAVTAVTVTARSAGARVLMLDGYDPRADPAAIRELAALKPSHVLALGAAFGPAHRLADRLAVAVTGVQLPGGGQVLFPMHRLVALYGYPGSPALGALGDQDLTASIARARRLAALYRPLSAVPVIPAFEIIASVAQGPRQAEGGTYSYVTPVDQIRPWVDAATAAGMYVVLDLQAGRASLLAQARYYRQLLERPNVGLAVDPEWKLQPGQLPLRQIGSVSNHQVNQVISWLAHLTAQRHLPQKLLVLHQFRLSMITDERGIYTRNDDLAIVIHMDGQGSQGEKLQTWDAVLGAAPRGVHFGWKNFFVKDHPMLTPSQTMARRPQPVMISYQ